MGVERARLCWLPAISDPSVLTMRCLSATASGVLPAPTRALQGATDKVQHSASGRGGDPIKTIAARRFAELDREGKGRVSFLQVRRCGLAYFGTRLSGVLSCRERAIAGAAL